MMHLRYARVYDGKRIRVSIHENSYDNSLRHVTSLLNNLKLAIPFCYKTETEPAIQKLDGNRFRKMLAVEFTISCDLKMDQAFAQLEKAGFVQGLEPIF